MCLTHAHFNLSEILFLSVSPSLVTSLRCFTIEGDQNKHVCAKIWQLRIAFQVSGGTLVLPAMMMTRGSDRALCCRRFGPWTGSVRADLLGSGWFCPKESSEQRGNEAGRALFVSLTPDSPQTPADFTTVKWFSCEETITTFTTGLQSFASYFEISLASATAGVTLSKWRRAGGVEQNLGEETVHRNI